MASVELVDFWRAYLPGVTQKTTRLAQGEALVVRAHAHASLLFALGGRLGLQVDGAIRLVAASATDADEALEVCLRRRAGLEADDVLEAVRRSCCERQLDCVHVDLAACCAFAARLVASRASAPADSGAGSASAAPFDSPAFAAVSRGSSEDEAGLLCLLDLLNFGGGYGRHLRAKSLGQYRHGEFGSAFALILEGVRRIADDANGRDSLSAEGASDGRPHAAEGARSGALRPADDEGARGSPLLSAERLARWTAAETQSHFLIPPPARDADDADARALAELAELITSALACTGAVLLERGECSLGSLVVRLLDGARPRAGAKPCASRFVRALAEALPPFRDWTLADPGGAGLAQPPMGATIHAGGVGPTASGQSAHGGGAIFLKKAQLCAASLAGALGGRDARFALAGLERLTAAADAVLPAVLRAEGCLVYADALAARVDGGEPLEWGEAAETDVRAAAVAACEAIAAVLGAPRELPEALAAAELRGTAAADAWSSRAAAEVVGGSTAPASQVPAAAMSASELDLLIWGILGKSERHRAAPRHITQRIWWH